MSENKILLTNDDGINAPGINALADALEPLADVLTVAPISEQSGMGRSISWGRSAASYVSDDNLEYKEEGDGRSYSVVAESEDFQYALRGSPCDCVIAGIYAFDCCPDLVISGCNPGHNMGIGNTTRSGTISAAVEAAYNDVTGVAVSTGLADGKESYSNATSVVREFVSWLLDQESVPADYFNINVPDTGNPSIKITRPSQKYYMRANKENDSFNIKNPMVGDTPGVSAQSNKNTDRYVFLTEKNASISPLKLVEKPVEVPKLKDVV